VRQGTRAFLVIWVLTLAAASPTPGQIMLETITDSFPTFEEISEAGVGEPVFSETRTVKRVGARTLERIVVTKQGGSILRGGELLGEHIGGREVYCASVFTVPDFAYLCLEDKNRDQRFDGIVARRYKPPKNVVVDVPYEKILVTLPDELAKPFKAELLYQGAGGGVLRLLYREFVSDLARPAFSQEATYDLSSEGETEVTFKGVRLVVTSAGNSSIRYRVASGFSRAGS
jgi:hypothetical protein